MVWGTTRLLSSIEQVWQMLDDFRDCDSGLEIPLCSTSDLQNGTNTAAFYY
jgi:hypothetical protein